MSGVEILSSIEVGVNYTSNWWLIGFIFLGCIVVGGIIRAWICHDSTEAIPGCLAGTLIGLLLWLFIGAATYQPTAYETHYKVTIDDSVSINEFLDKYEIIDQEGKIYTVRERD